MKLCSNPLNNIKCKIYCSDRNTKLLCFSCSRYGKVSKKKGKIGIRIIWKCPICCKGKEMSEKSLKRALNENRICKECHLKKMRMAIPKNWMSDKEKEIRRHRFKINNPSSDPCNKLKISNRMKENNPVKDPLVVTKIRIAHQNQRNKLDPTGQAAPMYNPNAISIIEHYGKENGYNFQHAENGGEFYIKELGYWVDGYDKENNIVIEFDEPHHFQNGQLKQKDIIRQEQIIKFLNCNFIRIKYDNTIIIYRR